MPLHRWRLTVLILSCAAVPLVAQEPARRLTAEDYARAERFLAPNVAPLVSGTASSPTWLADGRFWYRRTTPAGSEIVMVDPANAMRTVIDKAPEAPAPAATSAPPDSVLSPDRRSAAFIRDFNLWVRDIPTGTDRPLTTDGTRDFGYATNNAGWIKSDAPVLLWSPDSKKIATFQHDSRGVGEMYLVSTNVGTPRLEAWKYPLPQDKEIFRIHRVVIDVDSGTIVRLQIPPDQHRSTINDHVADGSTFLDVEWYRDSSHVAFVSSSRDHKEAVFRIGSASSGEVRTVLRERVETQFQSGLAAIGRVNWRVLPASREVLWWIQAPVTRAIGASR